jgi:hypothetical protein
MADWRRTAKEHSWYRNDFYRNDSPDRRNAMGSFLAEAL